MSDGKTLTGHIRSTVAALTDRDRPGKRSHPRTADVLELVLIEREEGVAEVCDEIGRLIKHGELYEPSSQTIALTSKHDGDGFSDDEAATMVEGVLSGAETALDEDECQTLEKVAEHLRSGGEDIPVIADGGA